MSMLWAVCNAHILSKIFAIQQPGVNIAVQMGHIRHLILVHQAGVYLGHIAVAQIERLATAPAPMCRVIAGATQHQNAQNVVQYTHLYRPAYQAVIALTVWQCNIIKNRENPGFLFTQTQFFNQIFVFCGTVFLDVRQQFFTAINHLGQTMSGM